MREKLNNFEVRRFNSTDTHSLEDKYLPDCNQLSYQSIRTFVSRGLAGDVSFGTLSNERHDNVIVREIERQSTDALLAEYRNVSGAVGYQVIPPRLGIPRPSYLLKQSKLEKPDMETVFITRNEGLLSVAFCEVKKRNDKKIIAFEDLYVFPNVINGEKTPLLILGTVNELQKLVNNRDYDGISIKSEDPFVSEVLKRIS